MAEAARLPFAGRTGKGVRIGVIDSGVHPSHSHIDGRIGGGVAIAMDGRIDDGEEAFLDRLGHGTAVTAAIQEKAPDAVCHAVKVFDRELRTTGTALVAAIDWCVANGMDVLNLSLGSTNPKHEPAFAAAVERARLAGAVIVAARAANDAACYPGSITGVLGVDLDWDCPRDGYEWRGAENAFYASGYPRPIPGVEPRRNLYGVSFAVANMSGFVARACEAAGEATADRPDRIRRALLAAERISAVVS